MQPPAATLSPFRPKITHVVRVKMTLWALGAFTVGSIDSFNQCLKLALGGDICFGPVDEVLASRDGEPERAILDLGYVTSLSKSIVGLLTFFQLW